MKLKFVLLFLLCSSFALAQEPEKWYERPLRISALQCNFENESYSVIDKWVGMGFNTEQLFHPMADNYSAIYDKAKHKELLTEYIRIAHTKGMKVILYLNVHILGPSIDDKKDIWSQKNKSGQIVNLYGTYPSICLNSSWRDYFFKVLDDLGETDIDGIFLDGPVIAKPGCFCGHCKAKYKAKYGEGFGSDSVLAWEFNAWTRDDFLQSAYNHWKKNNPEKIFYLNLPVLHSARGYVNIENALKYNDIIGTEGGFMFYKPAKESFLFRTSLTAKLLESYAKDKPRVIFMAADHKPWNWFMHTPAETELCIAASIANASNIWYGLHGSTELLKTEASSSAKKLLQFAKENELYYYKTEPDSKVGLFFGFVNSRISNDAKDESDFSSKEVKETLYGDTEDAFRGWYSILTEMKIPFDIVSEFNISSLDNYKVLVCPNSVAVDSNTLAAIKNFVKKGGRLIAESGFSIFDEKGGQLPVSPIKDVIGVKHSGRFHRHQPYNYFIFDSAFINLPQKYYPLPLLSWEVLPEKNSIVISRSLKDLAGRYVQLTNPDNPFIVFNKYFSGDAFYISGNFGEMFLKYHVSEYKNIAGKMILEKLNDIIIFDNAPFPLEVIRRKKGKETILHLINYGGGPTRPIEKINKAVDVRIKLPENMNTEDVYSLTLKSFLRKENGYFILPALNVYDVLIIK